MASLKRPGSSFVRSPDVKASPFSIAAEITVVKLHIFGQLLSRKALLIRAKVLFCHFFIMNLLLRLVASANSPTAVLELIIELIGE